MEYKLILTDSGLYSEEPETIEADDDFSAIRAARNALEEWIRAGEWGEHTKIECKWALRRPATEEEISDPKRPSIIRHEVDKDDIVEGRFCDRNTDHDFDYDDDDDKLYFKISEDMTINVEG